MTITAQWCNVLCSLLSTTFLPHDACISAACAVMRCLSVRLSVCLSVRCVDSVETNKHNFIFSPLGSQTTLVSPRQTSWRYFDGNSRNGDVECRWVGRNHDSEPILSQWSTLHRVLWTFGAESAIHSAATDRGELMTLVAGKWRCLLTAGNDHKVFMTKSLNVSSKTTEHHYCHAMLYISAAYAVMRCLCVRVSVRGFCRNK